MIGFHNESKRILCIRLDNMGDVIMSSPAFRALKQSVNCHITLLTSTAGATIAPYIEGIDDVIEFNVPWVKGSPGGVNELMRLVEEVRKMSFDMAIIFTVFSQNPLPAAMLAYMAGIPVRVAWCRENPYQLITDWIPENEPVVEIRHQVERDLELVRHVGANVSDDNLHLKGYEGSKEKVITVLQSRGLDLSKDWILIHPGVSEEKRRYPTKDWQAIIQLVARADIQIVVSGGSSDVDLITEIRSGLHTPFVDVSGTFSMQEFISLVSIASFVVCVNTVTAHIAAATKTPVIVLYALTNPQHAPWKAKGKVFVYDVPSESRSRNAVLQYFYKEHSTSFNSLPSPEEIAATVVAWNEAPGDLPDIPRLVGLRQKNKVLNFQEP